MDTNNEIGRGARLFYRTLGGIFGLIAGGVTAGAFLNITSELPKAIQTSISIAVVIYSFIFFIWVLPHFVYWLRGIPELADQQLDKIPRGLGRNGFGFILLGITFIALSVLDLMGKIHLNIVGPVYILGLIGIYFSILGVLLIKISKTLGTSFGLRLISFFKYFIYLGMLGGVIQVYYNPDTLAGVLGSIGILLGMLSAVERAKNIRP